MSCIVNNDSEFSNIKYVYRYEDCKEFSRLGIKPKCFKYKVNKFTKCGVWISFRFVNLKCNRKWAFPTVEEARKDYLRRKKNHKKILTAQMIMLHNNYWNALNNNWNDSMLECDF